MYVRDGLQVYRFLKAVVKHLVPMAMWGSTHNRELFFKHMKRFVTLRRFEFFGIQDLMQGYKVGMASKAAQS